MDGDVGLGEVTLWFLFFNMSFIVTRRVSMTVFRTVKATFKI